MLWSLRPFAVVRPGGQSRGNFGSYLTAYRASPRVIGALLLAMLVAGCIDSNKSNSESDISDASSVDPYTARVVLGQPRSVRLEFTSTSVLSAPRSIHVDERAIIWAERNPPLMAFDPDGRFITTFAASGSGPREVAFVDAITVGRDGSIYIYDGDNRRMSIFGPSYEFIDSYPIYVDRLRRMSVNDHGVVYMLREDYYRDSPGLIAFDAQGAMRHSWGKIPFSAKVQSDQCQLFLPVSDN